MNVLVVMGIAPCLEEDLSKLPEGHEYDYLAVGMDAMDRVKVDIKFMATYHNADISTARDRRLAAGLNMDYQVIAHKKDEGVDIIIPHKAPTGSSAMLGCRGGMSLGYTKIILCGCPLVGVNKSKLTYATFQKGWKEYKPEFAQTVRSMSGWTQHWLGAPTEEWLNAK